MPCPLAAPTRHALRVWPTTDMRGGGFVRLVDGVIERAPTGKRCSKDAHEGVSGSMGADDLHRYGGHGDGAVVDGSGYTGPACRHHDVAVTPSQFDRGPHGILDGIYGDAREHLGFDAIDDQDVDQIDKLRSERPGRRGVQVDDLRDDVPCANHWRPVMTSLS